MNYLTNYYKNLCEQLQEKVNHLTKLLETSTASDYDDSDLPPKGPTKFSIVDKIEGSMHSQSGETSTYLVHGDDGYHYTIAPRYGKAQWAHDNEDLGQAPKTWELTSKHKNTFDIIDRIDNPKSSDHQRLIKTYKIEIPETPDYDSDPTSAEDAQIMRMSQPKSLPRSGREGGGVSPYHQ